MEPNVNSIQKFIEKEFSKDSQVKLDFRVFNRETESFYETAPEMMLPSAGNAFFRISGEKIPVDKIVILRYIGVQDRNGRKIYEGDYLLTNEGNWCGFVVFSDGIFMLADYEGGYSAEPEWDECEIVSNICEMDGHVREYIQEIKERVKKCTQQNSSPPVRFMNRWY
ncbi:MAG: YopX family protein [Lentisphaeria bacterium]|nr:YopX family protein [Lentisphaeria bacterium]